MFAWSETFHYSKSYCQKFRMLSLVWSEACRFSSGWISALSWRLTLQNCVTSLQLTPVSPKASAFDRAIFFIRVIFVDSGNFISPPPWWQQSLVTPPTTPPRHNQRFTFSPQPFHSTTPITRPSTRFTTRTAATFRPTTRPTTVEENVFKEPNCFAQPECTPHHRQR